MPRAAPATRSQRFRSQSEFSDSSQRSNLFCTIMCFSSEALEVFVRIYEGVHVFKTTPIFRRSSRLQEPIAAHLPSLQSTIPATASTIQNPPPLDVSNNCNQCLFLQPMSFFGNQCLFWQPMFFLGNQYFFFGNQCLFLATHQCCLLTD